MANKTEKQSNEMKQWHVWCGFFVSFLETMLNFGRLANELLLKIRAKGKAAPSDD